MIQLITTERDDLYARYQQARRKGLLTANTRPELLRYILPNFAWFEDWMIDRFGGSLKPSLGTVCHARLFGNGACPAGCTYLNCELGHRHGCRSPWADHYSLWSIGKSSRSIGSVKSLVSQPYRLDRKLADEQAWAKEHGLDLHVYPERSFYRPECGLLIFTRK